jgi:hypothetical protein
MLVLAETSVGRCYVLVHLVDELAHLNLSFSFRVLSVQVER